jgi:hypothetical protein
MYKVTLWGPPVKVVQEYSDLNKAKRECRKLGHDVNLLSGNFKYYAPNAYVADEEGYLVYNPRFKRTEKDG